MRIAAIEADVKVGNLRDEDAVDRWLLGRQFVPPFK
jgi:hypothetical protein